MCTCNRQWSWKCLEEHKYQDPKDGELCLRKLWWSSVGEKGRKTNRTISVADPFCSVPQESWIWTALSSKANDWRNREHVVLDRFSNLKCGRSKSFFGEPLESSDNPTWAFSACPLNTSPCVRSKRSCVYQHHAHMLKHMFAWCRHTRRRFERTHWDVLSVHTFFFQRVHHTRTHTRTPHVHSHTQPHTQHNTSHFGSSHFCPRWHCSRVLICCSLVLLCICQPRQSMGRNRKWVLEDNLSEAVWRGTLRGPRPPATAWPRASSRVGATKFSSQQSPNPLPKKGTGKGQPRVNRRSQTPWGVMRRPRAKALVQLPSTPTNSWRLHRPGLSSSRQHWWRLAKKIRQLRVCRRRCRRLGCKPRSVRCKSASPMPRLSGAGRRRSWRL